MATQPKVRKGATGKKYQEYKDHIKVTYRDGSVRIVRPTDASFNATKKAMEDDVANKKLFRSGKSKTTAETALGTNTRDSSRVISSEAVKKAKSANNKNAMNNARNKVQQKADKAVTNYRAKQNNDIKPNRTDNQSTLQQALAVNRAVEAANTKKAVDILRGVTANSLRSGIEQGVNNLVQGSKMGARSTVNDLTNAGLIEGGQYAAAASMLAPKLVRPNVISNVNTQINAAHEAEQRKLALETAKKQQAIASKYNLNKGEQVVSDVVSNTVPIAPAILGGALTGGAAAMPIIGNYARGLGEAQALNNGATMNQAKAYGLGTAGAEIATEMMFKGMAGLPGIIKAGKVVEGIANPALRGATKFGLDMAGEGAEEIVAGLVDPVLQRVTYNPDAEWDAKDIAYQGLLGALGTGGVNAAAIGAGKLAKAASLKKLDKPGEEIQQQTITQNAQNQPQRADDNQTIKPIGNAPNIEQNQKLKAQQPQPIGKIVQNPYQTKREQEIAKIQQMISDEKAKRPSAYEDALEKALDDYTRPAESAVQTEEYRKANLEMSERTLENVSDKNVKAYQTTHPEVKKYYREQAEIMLQELNSMIDGGREYGIDPETRTVNTIRSHSRMASEQINRLLDHGMSKKQIRDGLERVIHDEGRENTANAKKAEIAVHDSLIHGYQSLDGQIPKNLDFLYGNADLNQMQEAYDKLNNEESFAQSSNVMELIEELQYLDSRLTERKNLVDSYSSLLPNMSEYENMSADEIRSEMDKLEAASRYAPDEIAGEMMARYQYLSTLEEGRINEFVENEEIDQRVTELEKQLADKKLQPKLSRQNKNIVRNIEELQLNLRRANEKVESIPEVEEMSVADEETGLIEEVFEPDWDNVRQADERALDQEVVDFYDKATKDSNLNIALVEGLPDRINGVFHNGVIHLNVNKVNDPDAVRTVFVHEVFHAMTKTDGYDSMINTALDWLKADFKQMGLGDLTREDLIQMKQMEYAELSGGQVQLSEEDALGELGAQFMEYAITDQNFVDRLVVEQPNLFQRIWEAIKRWADGFLFKPDEDLSDLELQQKALVEKAQRLYEHSYRELQKNGGQTKTEAQYMFAGTNSQTADRGTLAGARQMEADGVDMETIRQETGWHKSIVTGGKWVYEIDDSKAIFGEIPRNHVEWRIYELNNKFIDGDITETELAELRELNQLETGGKRRNDRLSDVFYHEELYKAYPELQNIKIEYADLGDSNGQFSPKKNTITLDNSVRLNNSRGRRILLHEIQHAVQEIEGLPRGASLEYWENKNIDKNASYDLYRNTAGEIMAVNTAQRYEKGLDAEGRKNTVPAMGDENTIYAGAYGESYDIGDNIIIRNTPSESDMQRIQEEYRNSTDEDMYDFIDDARRNGKNRYYRMSDITDSEAADIEQLTGINVSGFSRKISSDSIRHIDKRHGSGGVADMSLKDDADIARMNYVLKNYDSIEKVDDTSGSFMDKNNNHAPMVKYKKRVNGNYYVIEVVPDTKKQILQIISAYKEEKAPKHVADADNVSPRPNVRNAHAPDAFSVDSSISQNQQGDNNGTSYSMDPETERITMQREILKKIQQEKDLAEAQGKELSKAYSNTFMNSKLFTDTEKIIELLPEDAMYNKLAEKDSLKRAAERLDHDYDGTVKDLESRGNWNGIDLDASMMILQEKVKDAQAIGDYNNVRKWLKGVYERATEGGRFIQAFAKYSRNTAEGIMMEAERNVERAEKEHEGSVLGHKTKSRRMKKVDKEAQSTNKAIETAEQEAVTAAETVLKNGLQNGGRNLKDIQHKLKKAAKKDNTAERLANKVDDGMQGKEKEMTADQELVNELFKVVKELGIIPENEKTKKSPVDSLKVAIQNKERYTDVWTKAQNILKDRYKDDEGMLDALDDFFNKDIIPTYSKDTVNKAVSSSAKELNINLKEIVKQSKTNRDTALQQLTDYIISRTGAAETDAKMLSEHVLEEYNSILKKNAESRLKQLFPEYGGRTLKRPNKQNAFDKIMELINLGAYDNQAIVDIIKEKNGLPVLTNEDIANIQKYVDQANEYQKYSREWKVSMAKAQQIAADKMPQSMKNKVTQFKRIMMLSNTRTHTRNFVGNMPLAGVESLANIPAAGADVIASKVMKTQRTISAVPQLSEFAKGFAKGMKDTTLDIKDHVNTYRMGDETTTQYEMPRGRTFDNAFLNGIDSAVNYGLMFGDRPFFEGHYNKRLAELKRLGYDITSNEAKADAYAHAVDMVFQNDSRLARAASGFREALNDILTVKGFGLGDFVVPFVQTPANIADKLADYSPIGLMKAVDQLGDNDKAFDQQLFCRRIGRSLTGTTILALSYALAEAGIITGSSDDDQDKRRAMEVAGWKPYSIKINDKYYDYSFIQPVGMLLAIGADMYQEGQTADDLTDLAAVAGAGIKGGFNSFFNMSFFSSLTDFFGGYGDTASNMANAIMDFPTQFAPAVGNAITKTMDPYQRETYDPNPLKQSAKKVIAKLPMASQVLPIRQNVYGENMLHNQGRNEAERTIENMAIPTTISETQSKAVNDELLRLSEVTGDNSAFFTMPKKKEDFGEGKEVKMTADEWLRYIQNGNGYSAKEVEKLIATDYYKSLADDEKIKAVGSVKEVGNYLAKKWLADKHGIEYSTDEMENKLKILNECDNDYAKYIEMKDSFIGETDNKIEKMKVCDTMKMDYAYYTQVASAVSSDDMKTSYDANGKEIKGQKRKDKFYRYLNAERDAGRMTEEQWWYWWTKEYNAKKRTDNYPMIADCPYDWIKEENKREDKKG